MHGVSCLSIMGPERYVHDEKRLMVEEKMMARNNPPTLNNSNRTTSCTSSSTSSIGKNSDISGISLENNGLEDTEEEVQSSYKCPLDAMHELEDVLPIRKGISSFYNGKSKSFASLADVASCKELTKPENAYSKRRRNLLACTLPWDKTTKSNLILRNSNGGIAKRVQSATRNSLALAVAMSSLAASSSRDSLHSQHEMTSRSPPPSHCSHFHPRVKELQADCSLPAQRSFSAWRSFSLADLQECASETTITQTLQTETGPH